MKNMTPAGAPLPPGAQGSGASGGTDPLTVDEKFLQEMQKGEGLVLENVADADFTWIDAQGVNRAREDVLKAIASGMGPKVILVDEAAVKTSRIRYGSQVAVVQRHKDKTHTMHVWVKRPAGWRLLNIAETVEYGAVPYGGTTINATCTNPCAKVPFVPGNATQEAIMAAWQEQQTGPEGWLRRVAPENVSYSNNGVRTVASRIEVMNQQKASGASVASPALLWARIWDFDDAGVMISMQQGNNARAFWASRVFSKRNGLWLMMESYQMTVQDAPVMSLAK
jgi:hypothetical protein